MKGVEGEFEKERLGPSRKGHHPSSFLPHFLMLNQYHPRAPVEAKSRKNAFIHQPPNNFHVSRERIRSSSTPLCLLPIFDLLHPLHPSPKWTRSFGAPPPSPLVIVRQIPYSEIRSPFPEQWPKGHLAMAIIGSPGLSLVQSNAIEGGEERGSGRMSFVDRGWGTLDDDGTNWRLGDQIVFPG